MGGGNESPRQKMVGMMYLVLTALLALNVSKSILEAFVAIEENIQVANENEYARGQEKKEELEEVAQDKSNVALSEKASAFMKDVKKIDELTADMIVFLDGCKLDIMMACQEAITPDGKNAAGVPEEEALIHEPYDKAKSPCKPIRMHLGHVQGPDKYDEPMMVMGINEDIKSPKGKGKELWEKYNKYRKDVVELLVKSASTPENPYSLKCIDINKFEGNKDLEKQVDAMLKKGKISPDEIAEVRKIYISMSKNEFYKVHDVEGVHWIGKTWDHNPLVAGIASLSALEKEVLTARADAISLIRSRVGGGDFSFNKVQGFANGQLLATKGDEVEISVMMAAFDSDKQPEVKVTSGGGTVEPAKDGQAKVKVTANGSGEMKVAGTVMIRKKNGTPVVKEWEHTITIQEPQGSISLPDMTVLYQGYENKVVGTAAGFNQCDLIGSGCTIRKNGKIWIAVPTVGPGKTCDIAIKGTNTITKKSANLGSFTFKVKPLPPAAIYFGGKTTGETASKSATGFIAKFPPSIDLQGINFTVLDWKMDFKGRTANGTGNLLNATAIGYLKQAKPGDMVTFLCKYTDGKSASKFGACTVTLN
jgi:hypothetical protein